MSEPDKPASFPSNAPVQAARRLPSLNNLRAFEAAARLQSVTRAAQELSVTQSAVSHQIKALEEWLGVALVRREGRQLALTAHGTAYLPSLSSALDLMAHATTAHRTAHAAQRRALGQRDADAFFAVVDSAIGQLLRQSIRTPMCAWPPRSACSTSSRRPSMCPCAASRPKSWPCCKARASWRGVEFGAFCRRADTGVQPRAAGKGRAAGQPGRPAPSHLAGQPLSPSGLERLAAKRRHRRRSAPPAKSSSTMPTWACKPRCRAWVWHWRTRIWWPTPSPAACW
jgi:molybdenum-dependent DNA-binding transcriptional regulator ModE